MPTYDYLCNNCEDKGEYFDIPRNSHPSCRKCGSDDMQRLPSKINIGGYEMRDVSVKDLTGPRPGLRIRPCIAEFLDGFKTPALLIEKIRMNLGPSQN